MKKKILIIEKDKNQYLGLVNRQESAYDILRVQDAHEAIEKIKNEKFDIVLVDYFSSFCGLDEKDKESSLFKLLMDFQKLKEKIREESKKVWDMDGGEDANQLLHYLEENEIEKPPIAIYSRHAKSLIETDKLLPLFGKGIYLAWKPKKYPNDTKVQEETINDAKRLEINDTKWERRILKKIISIDKEKKEKEQREIRLIQELRQTNRYMGIMFFLLLVPFFWLLFEYLNVESNVNTSLFATIFIGVISSLAGSSLLFFIKNSILKIKKKNFSARLNR